MNNTYGQTFETMLDVLIFIVFADRKITWRDLVENVSDRDRATLNRYLKALAGLGYLEPGERAHKNEIKSYVPTEKAKQLFEAGT